MLLYMDNVRTKMNKFYQAQKAGSEAAVLRKEIVTMLKDTNLTKSKFDFQDRVIVYDKYTDYEGITQKQIRFVLEQYYPNIPADVFVKQVYDARKKKTIETLKVTKKRG